MTKGKVNKLTKLKTKTKRTHIHLVMKQFVYLIELNM